MVAKKHFTYPQILMDALSGPQETFEMESFCNNRYKLKVASDCYKALHLDVCRGRGYASRYLLLLHEQLKFSLKALLARTNMEISHCYLLLS